MPSFQNSDTLLIYPFGGRELGHPKGALFLPQFLVGVSELRNPLTALNCASYCSFIPDSNADVWPSRGPHLISNYLMELHQGTRSVLPPLNNSPILIFFETVFPVIEYKHHEDRYFGLVSLLLHTWFLELCVAGTQTCGMKNRINLTGKAPI